MSGLKRLYKIMTFTKTSNGDGSSRRSSYSESGNIGGIVRVHNGETRFISDQGEDVDNEAVIKVDGKLYRMERADFQPGSREKQWLLHILKKPYETGS